MEVKFSGHAVTRCKQADESIHRLKKVINGLPNITGKMRWRTSRGVLVIEKINPNLVLVKTFIPNYKFAKNNRCDYSYRKGCHVY